MTVEAVKFNDWKIPRDNRLDPFVLRLKEGAFQGFRSDGEFPVYSNGRKPFAAKTHQTHFVVHKGCEEDMLAQRDTMLSAILAGEGRLWFNTVTYKAPQMFCSGSANEVLWTPSGDNWRFADVTIEWAIHNSILYRPLNSGYMTVNGYTPVTIADNAFGEDGDERVFASFPVAVSPTDFVITVPGHIPTHSIIIRIESLAASGFVNPRITNQSFDPEIYFEYIGTGSTTSHFLQANAAVGPPRVRLSTDAGLSFETSPETGNVWPDCNIDDKQNPLFELLPGANNIRVTASGTPDFRVLFLWRPAYGMPV